MAVILLDDSFYEETMGDKYIDELISFIEKYFDVEVTVFHPYCDIGNSWAKRNMLSTIQLKLQKAGKLEIEDKNLVIPIYNSCYDKLGFSSEFIGEIQYLLSKYNNVLIPAVQSKHELDIKSPCDNVYILNHIYEETDSNIAHFIQNHRFMKNIMTPNISSPLPNRDICISYLKVQKSKIDAGEDKFITYSKVAKEVALRNGYKFDKIISDKNKSKKHKREIYRFEKKQYISTDFEKGCFEVCNTHGKHLGEYSYINEQTSPPDKTGGHDIKV